MTSHMRLFLMTCVAVITLLITGCSHAGTSDSSKTNTSRTPTTAADIPDTSRPLVPSESEAYPSGYDEWKQWSSGQPSTKLNPLFRQLGLPDGSVPKEAMAVKGFTAVTQLGTACVVTFMPSQGGPDLLNVAILSRFTPYGLAQVLQDGDTPGIKQFIDDNRERCTPGVTS